jgi:hypothetical protein
VVSFSKVKVKFLSTLLYIETVKVGVRDHHAVCVSVCLCVPLVNFEYLNQSL